MTNEDLAKNAALVSLDLMRQLLQALIVKDVLTAEEATLLVARTRDQAASGGRSEMVRVIEAYFGPELTGQAWIQRDALFRSRPEGQA